MPRHVVAIGVGGSGKRSLTFLKERLLESYGEVPDRIILLSLDTDDLREDDEFAGVRLSPAVDSRGRSAEYRAITTQAGVTLNTVFTDIRSGRTADYMDWVEYNKLDRILAPTEKDIRGGAQQRRPIGRMALFLRYRDIYGYIRQAISQMYADIRTGSDEEQELAAQTVSEEGKRLVFIIGSVAGGTGSGMFIDVANLVRTAINSNRVWQSTSVSGIIVLPDAFSSFVGFMDDPTNLKPNSFAALRELDRFMRSHSAQLPYMTRYDAPTSAITWGKEQPLDHAYLVDTSSASGGEDFDLTGNPDYGVFPVISDFILAHVDSGLGDQLATLRSNAGQHYNRVRGNMYSSFNVRSYVFPVRDIITSFSYRFLREMLLNYYLPVTNERQANRIENASQQAIETAFSVAEVAGEPNPPFMQELIAHTRAHDPEPLRTSWDRLLRLISASTESHKDISERLRQSLDTLEGRLLPTDELDDENSYARGRLRLLDVAKQFDDSYLGLPTDEQREESRTGGQWEQVLEPLIEAQRQYFVKVLDAYLLDILNQRDERGLLLPNRLAVADSILRQLQQRVQTFRKKLVGTWREKGEDNKRLRARNETIQYADDMLETQEANWWQKRRGVPQAAQNDYVNARLEKAELDLAYRVYQLALRVCDVLAGERRDEQGRPSVIETAWSGLRDAMDTMSAVDQLLNQRSRQHERARSQKRQIRVREYVTNPSYERQLYEKPDIRGRIHQAVLGQRGELRGLNWERRSTDVALDYHLITTWADPADQATAITTSWTTGAQTLFDRLIRSREVAASRLRDYFGNPAMFVNESERVQEPYLRYNPALNGSRLNNERYVSVRVQGAPPEAADFFFDAANSLSNMGFNFSTNGESDVTCTVMMIARGARLDAVSQFTSLVGDYRTKLSQGFESIHLLPEEKNATDIERRIPSLGLRDQQVRTLSPELVITMGDMDKVQAFTLACAYGLIRREDYPDESGRQTSELVLRLNGEPYRLTNSERIRQLDTFFANANAEAQLGWLLLDALQSFTLKWTQKNGIDAELIPTIENELSRLGVQLRREDKVDQPFRLPLPQVYQGINKAKRAYGPSIDDITPDHQRRKLEGKQRQAQSDALREYVTTRVRQLENSEVQKLQDLGVVMHLLLNDEIERLQSHS